MKLTAENVMIVFEDWLMKTITPDSEIWGYWLEIKTMLGEVSEEVAEKSAKVEELKKELGKYPETVKAFWSNILKILKLK